MDGWIDVIASIAPMSNGSAAGLSLLPSYEGGKAVRCVQEATNLSKAAAKAAAAYDKAVPVTQAAQHQHLDSAFNKCIAVTYDKVCC